MNHYGIYRLWDNSAVNSQLYTNKINAFKAARKLALIEKKSLIIVHEETDIAIAIAEFPYYLRNLNLDERDINLYTIKN